MAAQDLSALLDDLKGRTRLTADDTLAVRRVVFGGDWRISRAEAEALIALNQQTEDAAPEWNLMFVDTLTEYVVRQQQPVGYVDDATADWLVEALGRDGRVWRASELEAVTHILEQADSAPALLATFALEQARAMLTAADAPLVREDVELLRRIMFAPSGDGSLAITRAEARVLFDINDAVRGRDNDPAWTDFFARAIGNAVLAASVRPVQSREEALRQQAWLESPSNAGRSGQWFSSLFDGGFFKRVREDVGLQRLEMQTYVAEEERRLQTEVVTEDEASWIKARMSRDGVFDENEAAAIRFIEQHALSVDAALPHSAADLPETNAA